MSLTIRGFYPGNANKFRAAGLQPQASTVPGSGTAEPSPLAETCGKGGTIRAAPWAADAIVDLGQPAEISEVFSGFQKYLYQEAA